MEKWYLDSFPSSICNTRSDYKGICVVLLNDTAATAKFLLGKALE